MSPGSRPPPGDGRSVGSSGRGAALVLGGSVAVFLLVALLVGYGFATGFDVAAHRLLLPPVGPEAAGPWWLGTAVRDLTALGGRTVLLLVTAAAAGYLAAAGRPGEALFVLVAVAGALLVGPLLKELFLRPRPDWLPELSGVRSTSFPSTHSLQAAAVWPILAAALADAQPRRAARAWLLAAAIAASLLVGLSRVWLGVHFATDVVAGWSAGAAWAAAARLAWIRLARRR